MSLTSLWRPARDEVRASNGIVAAMHPLAVEAGLEMLRKGGNAIDAAVATGFAISVVEPNNSSIAGVGFLLVHLAADVKQYSAGTDLVVEYGPRAPMAATDDMYTVTGPGTGISTYETKDQENTHGYKSIAVPGTAAGLCRAHELMGVLPLEQVMEPAIQYAANGFESYWLLTLLTASNAKELLRYKSCRDIFMPGGLPPGYLSDPSSADDGANIVRQRDLGDLLKKISRYGAKAMYEGEVAYAIEEDMRKNGGLITREDLANRVPEVRTPLRVPYRGYEIHAATAPNGAWTVLQTMNILENFDLGSYAHNSPEHLHLFIESARHAFADRYHYMADPDFVDVPLEGLLAKKYAGAISRQINMEKALKSLYVDDAPWNYFATHAIHDPWVYESRSRPSNSLPGSSHGDGDCTTHFGVVDARGNLVSCTQTAVSSFGAKVVTDGLGILWNNGMIWFNPKPGFANSISPWKRPLVNAAPLLVTRAGKGYLSVGSPGGRKVNNANTNITVNVLDFGLGPQDAITSSRADASGAKTEIDYRMPPETVESLIDKGHNIQMVSDIEAWYSFARPSAVMIDSNLGIFRSGSDPQSSVPYAAGY